MEAGSARGFLRWAVEILWLPAHTQDGPTAYPAETLDGAPTPRVWALGGNLLGEGWVIPGEIPAGATVIAWSGTLGEGLWERHPLTWMPPGWARLEAALRRVLPGLAARDQRLVLRTHAFHVLGDLHAARRMLEIVTTLGPGAAERVGVVPDPASLFTRAMMPRAKEHAERMAELLPGLVDRDGLALGDLAPADRPLESDDPPEQVTIGEGCLDLGAWVRAVGAAVPRVYVGGDRCSAQGINMAKTLDLIPRAHGRVRVG